MSRATGRRAVLVCPAKHEGHEGDTKTATRPLAWRQGQGFLKHEDHEEDTKSTKKNSRLGFGAEGTEVLSPILSSCSSCLLRGLRV
jgi:hypothetical protein